MCAFVQESIRGGVSFIGSRYHNFDKTLDTNKSSAKCFYTDVNNLYGSQMQQKLPIDGYKWLSQEEINDFDIDKTDPNSDIGYILEVSLLYPKELHTLHDEFPLAPHKHQINFENLSPLAQSIHTSCFPDKLGRHKTEKLVGTLLPRVNYVTHYVNLKFYKDHGLVISKIHRGIKFRQDNFLRPFIDLCTKLRANSDSDFERELFKLLANSSYGEFIALLVD